MWQLFYVYKFTFKGSLTSPMVSNESSRSQVPLLLEIGRVPDCHRVWITVFIRIEAPGAKTKFWGGVSFKNNRKDQYIVGAIHEYNFNCKPMSPGCYIFAMYNCIQNKQTSSLTFIKTPRHHSIPLKKPYFNKLKIIILSANCNSWFLPCSYL